MAVQPGFRAHYSRRCLSEVLFFCRLCRYRRLPGVHSVILPGFTVSLFAFLPFYLFLLKQVPDDLDVSGENSQGDVSIEGMFSPVRASVQAMIFKGVNGRFDRCMLSSG